MVPGISRGHHEGRARRKSLSEATCVTPTPVLENCAPTLSGACLACVGHIMVAARGKQSSAVAVALAQSWTTSAGVSRRNRSTKTAQSWTLQWLRHCRAQWRTMIHHRQRLRVTTPPPAVPASRFHRTSTCSGCLTNVSREDPLQHQQRTVHMFLPWWCIVLSASCFRSALVVHTTCQHQQRTPHTFQSWSPSSRH